MITPLNYLLSGYNESFEYDVPIEISAYMSDRDCDFIKGEVSRLENRVKRDVSMATRSDGSSFVDRTQLVNGEVKDIHPYTALLLERIVRAVEPYKDSTRIRGSNDTAIDMHSNNIVMHIEGNPNFVYTFVYTTMMDKTLRYKKRIEKINDIRDLIVNYGERASGGRTVEDDKSASMGRMRLHSHKNYWKSMLIFDYYRIYGVRGPEFGDEVFDIMHDEAKEMGFPGFVNPLKMYMDFVSSRVSRKTDLSIDGEVVRFLERVVKSGGVVLR